MHISVFFVEQYILKYIFLLEIFLFKKNHKNWENYFVTVIFSLIVSFPPYPESTTPLHTPPLVHISYDTNTFHISILSETILEFIVYMFECSFKLLNKHIV